jgi:hypothetical protein
VISWFGAFSAMTEQDKQQTEQHEDDAWRMKTLTRKF